MSNPHRPGKPCATCGREIVWRKKWARDWENVRYCSDACRRGTTGDDRALEQAILQLLDKRPHGASICPSEAARLVFGENDWRSGMEAARRAARRLVHAGKVVITQRGHVVDPSRAKGPIRIRRVP